MSERPSHPLAVRRVSLIATARGGDAPSPLPLLPNDPTWLDEPVELSVGDVFPSRATGAPWRVAGTYRELIPLLAAQVETTRKGSLYISPGVQPLQPPEGHPQVPRKKRTGDSAGVVLFDTDGVFERDVHGHLVFDPKSRQPKKTKTGAPRATVDVWRDRLRQRGWAFVRASSYSSDAKSLPDHERLHWAVFPELALSPEEYELDFDAINEEIFDGCADVEPGHIAAVIYPPEHPPGARRIISEIHLGRRYRRDELAPPTRARRVHCSDLRVPEDTEQLEAWAALAENERRSRSRRAHRKLAQMPQAIAHVTGPLGQGHRTTLCAMMLGGDYGIPESIWIEEVVASEWNARNEPAWGIDEARQRYTGCYGSRSSEYGSHLPHYAVTRPAAATSPGSISNRMRDRGDERRRSYHSDQAPYPSGAKRIEVNDLDQLDDATIASWGNALVFLEAPTGGKKNITCKRAIKVRNAGSVTCSTPTRRLAIANAELFELPDYIHSDDESENISDTFRSGHKRKPAKELGVEDELPISLRQLKGTFIKKKDPDIQALQARLARPDVTLLPYASWSTRPTLMQHVIDLMRMHAGGEDREVIHVVAKTGGLRRTLRRRGLDDWYRDLFGFVGPEAKAGILCGSRRSTEAFEVALKEHDPSLRVLAINGRTKCRQIEKLLRKPNDLLAQYDVIIFNSAVGEGVSFTDPVDRLYVFHDYRKRTGDDQHQIVSRFRNVRDEVVRLYMPEWPSSETRPTDSDTVRGGILERAKHLLGAVPKETPEGRWLLTYLTHEEARANAGQNDPEGSLITTCERVGWVYDDQRPVGDKPIEVAFALRRKIKLARQAVKRARKDRIRRQPDRDKKQRKRAAKKYERDADDHAADERDAIRLFFGLVNNELIELDYDGGFRRKVARYVHCLLILQGRSDIIRRLDTGERPDRDGPVVCTPPPGTYVTDIGTELLQAEFALVIAEVLGLTFGSSSRVTIENRILRQRIAAWLDVHGDDWLSTIGISRPCEMGLTQWVLNHLRRAGARTSSDLPEEDGDSERPRGHDHRTTTIWWEPEDIEDGGSPCPVAKYAEHYRLRLEAADVLDRLPDPDTDAMHVRCDDGTERGRIVPLSELGHANIVPATGWRVTGPWTGRVGLWKETATGDAVIEVGSIEFRAAMHLHRRFDDVRETYLMIAPVVESLGLVPGEKRTLPRYRLEDLELEHLDALEKYSEVGRLGDASALVGALRHHGARVSENDGELTIEWPLYWASSYAVVPSHRSYLQALSDAAKKNAARRSIVMTLVGELKLRPDQVVEVEVERMRTTARSHQTVLNGAGFQDVADALRWGGAAVTMPASYWSCQPSRRVTNKSSTRHEPSPEHKAILRSAKRFAANQQPFESYSAEALVDWSSSTVDLQPGVRETVDDYARRLARERPGVLSGRRRVAVEEYAQRLKAAGWHPELLSFLAPLPVDLEPKTPGTTKPTVTIRWPERHRYWAPPPMPRSTAPPGVVAA